MACQWQTCQFWCLVENGNQSAWCWTKASHSLITNISSPTEVIVLDRPVGPVPLCTKRALSKNLEDALCCPGGAGLPVQSE